MGSTVERGTECRDKAPRATRSCQQGSRSAGSSRIRFLVCWVIATLLGAGTAAAVSMVMLNPYAPYIWQLAQFLATVGVGVGAAQAVVVAGLWASSGRPVVLGVSWMLGTVIGLGVGGCLGLLMSLPVTFVMTVLLGYHWLFGTDGLLIVFKILCGFCAAVIVGLTQQFVVREHADGRGVRYLAGIAGWVIGLASGYCIGTNLHAAPAIQGLVGGGVGGLITGGLTGLGMLRWVPVCCRACNAAFPKNTEAGG